MTSERYYTISELADLVGVTPRTIRYYTSEGLLPPPDIRGRVALYSADHANRLWLIARLKESYLPLSEIKARLDQLTTAQERQLLEEFGRAPLPTAPTNAADYIAQTLTKKSMIREEQTIYEELSQTSMAQYSSNDLPRVAPYPPTPTGAPSPSNPTAPPPQTSAVPITEQGSAMPTRAPSSPSPTPSGLLSRLIPKRRAAARERTQLPPTSESWQRVTLAPGVELHLHEPLPSPIRERIERLIALAHDLFHDSNDKA